MPVAPAEAPALRDRRPLYVLLGTAAVVAGVVSLLLRPHPPADSRDPAFTQERRIQWMADRITGGPPTPILDAHFLERAIHHEGSHMGPGWSMWTFHARIDLPPGSGPAWIARSQPLDRPASTLSFETRPASPWGYSPGEVDGAAFVEGKPLFGTDGVVAVTADDRTLFVYLVRR